MAHHVTRSDKLFTVRKPAWHGLGHLFDEYPTREAAQKLVHDWEPITSPVFADEPIITETGPETIYVPIPGYKRIVRSDNGKTLGVVSETFETVSNNDLWDIAESIQGDNVDVKFETAGSLKGGAKVWILVRLNEPIMIPGDKYGATLPYIALQNAHDGSGACRAQSTFTRIVCDNTAQAADLDARMRGTEFVFKHTKNIASRISQVRTAVAGWRQSIDDYQQFSQDMIATRITPSQREWFVEKFIPAPPAGLASDRVLNNIAESRFQLSVILENSPTCEGIEDTAYGLYQAGIEYSQHARKARTEETHFKRAYLTRTSITSTAVKLARQASLV